MMSPAARRRLKYLTPSVLPILGRRKILTTLAGLTFDPASTNMPISPGLRELITTTGTPAMETLLIVPRDWKQKIQTVVIHRCVCSTSAPPTLITTWDGRLAATGEIIRGTTPPAPIICLRALPVAMAPPPNAATSALSAEPPRSTNAGPFKFGVKGRGWGSL